eukprot:2906708-Lingulodinium_polyedra.AAC.1
MVGLRSRAEGALFDPSKPISEDWLQLVQSVQQQATAKVKHDAKEGIKVWKVWAADIMLGRCQ